MGVATRTTGFRGYRWRPWKVFLLVIGGLLLIVGLITGALSGEESGDSAGIPTASSSSGSTPGTPGVRSFGVGTDDTSFPDAEPAAEAEPEETGVPWSPALFRGGISFFAAFVLAFAFRSFLRIAVFFLGLWVASLFLLSSVGWIQIHWGIIDHQFVAWSSQLGEQFKSLTTFVTGSLPSAGMAGLGLFTGFKKG